MDVNDLIAYLIAPATQVTLIICIAELCKQMGIRKKLLPLIDMILGLISGIFVFGLLLDYGVAYGVILGVSFGLTACGLFSGVKNLMEARHD